MPAGGQITISTRHASFSSAEAHSRPGARPGEFVVLSVRDTGTGMDEATKTRIFEPFFTTKGVGKGTGMGLATVAGIVQQSGGFIEVDTAPNCGTEMSVYLPRVHEKPATLEVDGRITPASGGNESVLIFEEDDVLRKLLRRVVQLRGYRVIEAATAEQALQGVRSAGSISLALVNPPPQDTTCKDFAAQLRQLSPRSQIVVVADNFEHCEQLRASHFHAIQKPFTSLDLARTIRSVLDAGGTTPRR